MSDKPSQQIFKLADDLEIKFITVPEGEFEYGYPPINEYPYPFYHNNVLFCLLFIVINVTLIKKFISKHTKSEYKNFTISVFILVIMLISSALGVYCGYVSNDELNTRIRNIIYRYEMEYYAPEPAITRKMLSFALMETEVTNELYDFVMHGIINEKNIGKVIPLDDPDLIFQNFDHKLPKVCTYIEALQFSRRLEIILGGNVRIPNRIEWEYACRAGSNNLFIDKYENLSNYAWVKSSRNHKISLQPVGLLKPNAWGFYDMLGNAREWCSDVFILSINNVNLLKENFFIESVNDEKRINQLLLTHGTNLGIMVRGASLSLPEMTHYMNISICNPYSNTLTSFRVVWEK